MAGPCRDIGGSGAPPPLPEGPHCRDVACAQGGRKIFLAVSGPISLDQKFSSAPLAPLSTAWGGGGGLDPPPPPLASLGKCSHREGGAPNPPQPHLHLRARMGERTARGLGRVAPQRIPHRTEARVLPSRRDTLGGRGGVRALYICIQLYIDELSPANPLIPSIALASRT